MMNSFSQVSRSPLFGNNMLFYLKCY